MNYELVKMALSEIRSGMKKVSTRKIAVVLVIVLNLKVKVMLVIYQRKFSEVVVIEILILLVDGTHYTLIGRLKKLN